MDAAARHQGECSLYVANYLTNVIMERIYSPDEGHVKQKRGHTNTRYGVATVVTIFFFIYLFIDLTKWPRPTDVRTVKVF